MDPKPASGSLREIHTPPISPSFPPSFSCVTQGVGRSQDFLQVQILILSPSYWAQDRPGGAGLWLGEFRLSHQGAIPRRGLEIRQACELTGEVLCV